jgi:hypothetical protein
MSQASMERREVLQTREQFGLRPHPPTPSEDWNDTYEFDNGLDSSAMEGTV